MKSEESVVELMKTVRRTRTAMEQCEQDMVNNGCEEALVNSFRDTLLQGKPVRYVFPKESELRNKLLGDLEKAVMELRMAEQKALAQFRKEAIHASAR